MLKDMKNTMHAEIEEYARNNIIKKLSKEGINYRDLDVLDFEGLIDDEIEILKTDTKKVGVGIGVGILLTLVTGI